MDDLSIKSDAVPVAESDQDAALFRVWETLSEDERIRVLPKLVDSTSGWHEWTVNPSSCLAWWEANFQKAGITFPQTARME